MAIDRSFEGALQKAVRSLETGRQGSALGRSGLDRRGDPGAGRGGRTTSGSGRSWRRCGAAVDVDDDPRAEPHRPLVPLQAGRASSRWSGVWRAETLDAGAALGGEARRVLRRARSRRLAATGQRRTSTGCARAAAMFPVYKMVDTCAGEFAAATPYFYSTYEEEDEATPIAGDAGGRRRLRPDPHRPGHRVRLLLGAGGPGAARRRRRLDHDQLEPGDGLDRLRRLRPPLLRTARRRKRGARSCATNADGDAITDDAAGHRPVRRADGDQPRRAADRARRADPRQLSSSRSTWPRTGTGSRLPARARHSAAARRGGDVAGRRARRWPSGSATRCSCGPPTCSAAGRWRSSTAQDQLARYIRNAAELTPEHPVLIDKYLMGKEVEVDAICDGEQVLDPGHHGAHRARRRPLRRLVRGLSRRSTSSRPRSTRSSTTPPGSRWRSARAG